MLKINIFVSIEYRKKNSPFDQWTMQIIHGKTVLERIAILSYFLFAMISCEKGFRFDFLQGKMLLFEDFVITDFFKRKKRRTNESSSNYPFDGLDEFFLLSPARIF